ncbi:NTP transferase domain-containing protein [Micromonospora sp. NPDC005806]|uniref:NTP transferase domain-containing protein n=1 Tax=Micromonospora sp. NPDC005806 TaxID=3364234 RepID=UPI003689D29F
MMAAGLLLAVGGGRRFGRPKALVRHDGQLLVDRSIAILRAARCAPRCRGGRRGGRRRPGPGRPRGVAVIGNPDWTTGMGSSLGARCPYVCQAVRGHSVVGLSCRIRL